jgi:ubiquinone/menaquinone biosynthesis C-methylase UbiE
MVERPLKKMNGFSKKMMDILNYGALNLAIAIGYRTRLLDVLDEFETPQSVAAIARKAGLNTRYVKEWLGVMVCGGIIELDSDDDGEDQFWLPFEHGELITRRAGNSNLGIYTQEIPLLTACAMESVVRSFFSGEGVDYDQYPRFQSFMSQLADAKHQEILVDRFLPTVDEGRLVEKMLSGIRVCDLGCGEGVAIILMAEAFPNSEFVGIDISEAVIKKAEKAARSRHLQNVRFLQLDAAALRDNQGLKEYFDYVTAFDAVHDQTHPREALKGVYAVLRKGGLFSMVDIAASSSLSENRHHPMGSFLYTVSLMHCMPVGLVNDGLGLGMMWGRQKAAEMLKEAGFENVEVLDIIDDPFNLHFFSKKEKP